MKTRTKAIIKYGKHPGEISIKYKKITYAHCQKCGKEVIDIDLNPVPIGREYFLGFKGFPLTKFNYQCDDCAFPVREKKRGILDWLFF